MKVQMVLDGKLTPLARDIISEARSRVIGDEPLEVVWLGELPLNNGVPIISFGKTLDTLLPYAYLPTVKQIEARSTSVSDVMNAIRLVAGGLPEYEINYEVIKTWDDLPEFDENLVIDIETSGNIKEDTRDELGLLSVGMWDGDLTKPVYIVPEEMLQENADLVRLHGILASHRLVAHNGKFDVGVLNAHLPGPSLYVTHDTMLLHYAIHPAASEHGLKFLCRLYLAAPEWEKGIKDHLVGGDYASIPREILYRYNAADVYFTGLLLAYFMTIVNEDQWKFYGLRMEDSHFLQDVEGNGIHIDLDYAQELGDILEERIESLTNRIRAIVADYQATVPGVQLKTKYKEPPPFNPGSWQQVQKYLRFRGIKASSTDEETITAIKNSGKEVEFCEALLELRGYKKQLGTYVDGLTRRSRGGWVYPTFQLTGTITGRLSSSNPNAQNIPRDKVIKKLLDAPEGYSVVSCDYSQVEARVMAVLSGDAAMQAKFQRDSLDFFDQLMPVMFPEDFPTVDTYLKYETEECDGDEKEYRAKAKGVIYGLSFDRGPRAIGEALGMTTESAEEIIANFLEEHPQLDAWRDWIRKQASSGGELMTKFHMAYEKEVITDWNRAGTERSALAFMPQSHASQIMVNAAKKIHAYLNETGYGFISALVHDAWYGLIKDEYAEQVKDHAILLMEEAGREALGDAVIFAADGKVGKTWAEV